VFAVQYRQAAASVTSYGSFRQTIDCLLRRYVLPFRAHGRPNVVVFDEDTGLATIATGSRGENARKLFAQPRSPGCGSQGEPCGAVGAISLLTAAYAGPLAAYHLRLPGLSGKLADVWVGATDTIVRSFMGAFSAEAKRYGLYMVASADLAPFRQSRDPADLATFSDPDLNPRPDSVYVATAPDVFNEAFLWGPHDVRRSGPDVMRNVLMVNRKVPLTSLEQAIGFAPGPATGPSAAANLRPYRLPGTRAKLGIATSLPAFTYGAPPTGVDPCSDTASYYMRCLDRLGANIVLQDEANPGAWTGADGDGVEKWQPLSWMSSTYRTAADPSVHFAYNVTAMMVGNLADLTFDGQSAITQRGGTRTRGCHYIGNRAFLPAQDEGQFRGYAGARRDFLALAPWVTPDGPRDRLRAIGAALAPGSGSRLEDDYVETGLVADLPLPVDRHRRGCVS
jgi:hypothetical protein